MASALFLLELLQIREKQEFKPTRALWNANLLGIYIFILLKSSCSFFSVFLRVYQSSKLGRILYLLCSLTRCAVSGARARSTATASLRRSRSVPAWNSPRSTSRTCWTPWWRWRGPTSARLMPCCTTGRRSPARPNIRGCVTASIPTVLVVRDRDRLQYRRPS